MSFPADFHRFITDFVFPQECAYLGGYGGPHAGDMNFVVSEDVPNDDGGLTKYGIDQASHSNVDINALTADTAEMVYWEDFCKSDSIMLPGRLALYHFDEVVNAGPGAENPILQKALGVDADGVLGPQTLLAAWNAWGNAPATLVSAMLDARAAHYKATVAAKPKDAGFLKDWLQRVEDLRMFQFDPNKIVK